MVPAALNFAWCSEPPLGEDKGVVVHRIVAVSRESAVFDLLDGVRQQTIADSPLNLVNR